MRTDSTDTNAVRQDHKPRPRRRAELLEDNRRFVEMATDLLHLMRTTDDRSCACCGAPVGKQHRPGHICRELVEWRASTLYGEIRHA